jgi:hypothetical protein
MRTTKTELKQLIKECLVEILAEGLGPTLQNEVKAPRLSTNTFSNKPSTPSRAPEPRRPTPALREAIRREAGGNKVMESIFADTAATTLASQLANGDVSPTSTSKQLVQQQISGTPEQIFGEEATSKWANLAFMDSPTKK